MRAYTRFIARDGGLLALAIALWWLLAERSAGAGATADFAGFVAGAMLGVAAYLLHEWGHVIGGLASGSAMTAAGPLSSRYLFRYDAEKNSLGQFLVMSSGGFLVTAAIVWAYHVYLPDGLLASRVARGASLFLAFLGLVLEFPLVLLAIYRGAAPAEAAVSIRAGGPAEA